MFTVRCHVHGSTVLLDASRIEAIHNTARGPALDWTCWCGARGHLLPSGRSVPRRGTPPVAA
jgi:hypothetical protein